MDILNSIEHCLDREHNTRMAPWQGETLHRILIDGAHDAAGYARFFRGLAAVGNIMPYTALYWPNGSVSQCLPFNRIGWHARRYSRKYLGLGIVGDTRIRPPTDEQMESVLKTLWWCSMQRGGVVDTFGHTEKQDATSWNGHQCPGRFVDMDEVRAAVLARVQASPECPPNPGFVLE